MKKNYLLIAISAAILQGCYTAGPYQSSSRVSVGLAYPSVSIGINYATYPDLVQIPGYPVYYAPRVSSNYFFYDGLYWVFHIDNWYASSWYNGPWDRIGYHDVPVYLLRVPVSYYRLPPPFFRGWRADAPPRWGDHWGRDWEQRRRGWDRWDRAAAPSPAPLPTYQRAYSGERYPRSVDQQQTIRSDNDHHKPRDPATEHNQQRGQQDQTRQQEMQRQQDPRREQADQLRQRSQPEPKGKDYRAAAPDRAKKDKHAQDADELKKRKDDERDRGR